MLAALGVSRIEVSTSLIDNFAPDHPLRVGFERIDEHLNGSNTLNVVIDTEREDAFKTPASLREIRGLQAWLEAAARGRPHHLDRRLRSADPPRIPRRRPG